MSISQKARWVEYGPSGSNRHKYETIGDIFGYNSENEIDTLPPELTTSFHIDVQWKIGGKLFVANRTFPSFFFIKDRNLFKCLGYLHNFDEYLYIYKNQSAELNYELCMDIGFYTSIGTNFNLIILSMSCMVSDAKPKTIGQN